VRCSAGPSGSTHVAFTASSRHVDAFHAAALAAGGRDNGAPGDRPYGGSCYAALVLDPDRHYIEAVFHGPRRATRPRARRVGSLARPARRARARRQVDERPLYHEVCGEAALTLERAVELGEAHGRRPKLLG